MSTITLEAAILEDLLVRKDALVRSITAGMASGEWDQVMGAFDGLLAAIQRIEEALENSRQTPAP